MQFAAGHKVEGLRRATVAVLPALLLLSSAVWTGTLQAPLQPWMVLAGHGVLALFVALMAGSCRQASAALGWTWVPVVLLTAWLVAGVLMSPVPRAGWLALALWPMFLLLPSAVANCWRRVWQRRLGLQAVAVVLVVVSSIGLWHWSLGHSERAALPLGHHNLLALWLVTLAPLLSRLTSSRKVSTLMLVGLAIVVSGWTLAAGRSLSAAVGLMSSLPVAAIFAWRQVSSWPDLRRRRRRQLVVGALILGMLLSATLIHHQGDRLARLATGDDSSWAARSAYWQAAWQGGVERPWGWGAGSTAWTLSRFMPVRPGVLPAGAVVADVHSLPLGVLYELGWPGLLLVTWLLASQWGQLSHRRRSGKHRRWLAAICFWIFAVTSLAGAPFTVLALPTALAVAVGWGLRPTEPGQGNWKRAWPVGIFIVFILPLDLAAIHYSRAIDGETFDDQRRALVKATDLDPRFPLYRAQLAILDGYRQDTAASPSPQVPGTDFGAYLEAAEQAHAVAPLWLLAGAKGQVAGVAWDQRALVQACDLDPLSAMAPFLLAAGEPPQERTAQWGARALAAEPRLLAATAWRLRPAEFAAAVALLVQHPSLDAGWRQRLEESHRRIVQGYDTPPTEVLQLSLGMDGKASDSLSLYAFRRPPWPTDLVVVDVDAAPLQWLDLASLSQLRSTDPHLFEQQCLLGPTR